MRFSLFIFLFSLCLSVTPVHAGDKVSHRSHATPIPDDSTAFLKFSLLANINQFFPEKSFKTPNKHIDLKPPSFMFSIGARVHKNTHIFFGLDFASVRYRENYATPKQKNDPVARLTNFSMFSIPVAVRRAILVSGKSRLNVQAALMYTNTTKNSRNLYPDSATVTQQMLMNTSTYNATTDLCGNIGILYEYKVLKNMVSLIGGIDYTSNLIFREDNKQTRRLGIRLGAEINLY